MALPPASVPRLRATSLNPTCPLELYTKKRFVTLSVKAPLLPTRMLRTPQRRKNGAVRKANGRKIVLRSL